MWIKRFPKAIILLILVGLMLMQVQTSQVVHADEPTLVVLGGAALIAGFVATFGGALWAVGGVEGLEKAVSEVMVESETVSSGGGGEEELDRIVDETGVESESPAQVLIPQDFRKFRPVPKGYTLQEEIHFNAREDNHFELSYENLRYHTDVMENPGDARREFKVNRVTTFNYTRPAGTAGEPSELNLNFEIPGGIFLSTTDIPDTVGGVSLEFLIEVNGIGTVFSASADVRQGKRATFRGDIPSSVFDTSKLGELTIGHYQKKLLIAIPKDMNHALITVTFNTYGFGENCEVSSKFKTLRTSDCPGAKSPSPAPSPGGLSIPEAIDSNNDGVIDQAELGEAIQYWIMGESVPGADEVIDDGMMNQLVQMWILGTSVDVTQTAKATNLSLPQALQVDQVRLSELGSFSREVRLAGQGIASTQVQVYDLAGQMLVNERVNGPTVRFDLANSNGQTLANGVYLYMVRAQGASSELWRSDIRKFVVLN